MPSSLNLDSIKEIASTALAITSQDWKELGQGSDEHVVAVSDLPELVDRVTCLLTIRLAAWLLPHGTFSDLSTTAICRDLLIKGDDLLTSDEHDFMSTIPLLHTYTESILSQYQDVPYHNVEHAYHVIISTNKLLDMILLTNAREVKTFGLRDDALMQLALLFSAVLHDVEHVRKPLVYLAC